MLNALEQLSEGLNQMRSLEQQTTSTWIVTPNLDPLPDARLHWEFDGNEGELGNRLSHPNAQFEAVRFRTQISDKGIAILFDSLHQPSRANTPESKPLNYFWRLVLNGEDLVEERVRVAEATEGEIKYWLGAEATRAAA
jgi:hypothetical protein